MPDWLYSAHPGNAMAAISEVPSWLHDTVTGPHPWGTIAFRLAIAMLLGVVVAAIYAATQRRPARHILPLFTTLVLLTILVAMTTIVIGDSIARAFGLVGALSIVRFRTVVEDTRDTAFVIFAVVIGMAMGAGNLLVCLIGIPAVALIAILLSFFGKSFSPSVQRLVEIRLNAAFDPDTLLTPIFQGQLHAWHLASVTSAKQGTAIDVAYRIRLRDTAAILPLVRALQEIEGVFAVDIKEERSK